MCEVKEIQIRTWGWLGTRPEGCYGHPTSQRWVSPHLLRPREHGALHRLPPPPQHLDLGLSLLSADTTVSECAVCRLPELCAIWVVVMANSCRKLSPGTPPASHLVSPPFPPWGGWLVGRAVPVCSGTLSIGRDSGSHLPVPSVVKLQEELGATGSG